MVGLDDWLPIAYHEAGHAVAVVAHKGFLEKILIRKDHSQPYIDRRGRQIDCMGIMEGGNFYSPLYFTRKADLVFEGPDPALQVITLARMMKKEISVCLAGGWAEADLCLPKRISMENRRWTLRTFHGAKDDYQRVFLVLKEMQILTRRGALKVFEDEAWDLVRTYRDAITEIATLLLEREVLKYDSIAEICSKHGVIYPPVAEAAKH